MNTDILVVPELNEELIASKIYIIRGQKVMLDFELAEIYGYETKRFNEQVKNNIERFDEDFRFRLTKEEYDLILRSKKSTAQIWTVGNKGGRTSLPYAFTEQGIYMLMTVLKGDLATKQSKTLIRLFKTMKDYLVENNNMLTQKDYLNLFKLINNNSDRIKELEDEFKLFSKVINSHYLILNGERIEGDIAYQEIYRIANKSIYIIDDYIDIKTLKLLKSVKDDIEIMIFSDNKSRNNLNSNFINDFINDTGFNIQFKKNNNRFHDRYIIIDFDTESETIFHCGASSKDAGKRITTITRIEEQNLYKDLIKEIIDNDDLIF
ncbi:MAG: ORF6N domain-containing protein [Bacillales bacterium]|nr:ORF6N domain-containing protein [Bacillales bacterium]MDY6141904.1 ORF6N domain-containing protein [Bacilli bacterium]